MTIPPLSIRTEKSFPARALTSASSNRKEFFNRLATTRSVPKLHIATDRGYRKNINEIRHLIQKESSSNMEWMLELRRPGQTAELNKSKSRFLSPPKFYEDDEKKYKKKKKVDPLDIPSIHGDTNNIRHLIGSASNSSLLRFETGLRPSTHKRGKWNPRTFKEHPSDTNPPKILPKFKD